MTYEAFLTHAERARLVAERGHSIFEDLVKAQKDGAKDLREAGELEAADEVEGIAQTLSDWWSENCEIIDLLVHDFCELQRDSPSK